MSGNNYLDEHPLDQARLDLHNAGQVVDALAEVPGRGWVILWHDKKGYSVSHVSAGGAGTGGALDLTTALGDFRQALDALLWEVGK